MSLSTLPTEIFYRILDFVDFQDIFFGLRPTCRRIYEIIKNYDRLHVNFTSLINGREFRPLCRKIRPKNVVSLSFEIDGVLDRSCLDELSRFLTNDSRIRSISIVDDESYVWIRPSLNLLQSMVNLPNLRQLSLDIDRSAIALIVWPECSSIEKLKLRRCSFATWRTISDRLTKLNDFRVLDDFANNIAVEFRSTLNRSITSLTLYRLRISIEDFHDFLSLNENLRSLDFSLQHFIDEPSNEYFSRWENFLRSKLRNLKHFDVNFYGQLQVLTNVESVLQPLCSSFWLEEKKWFFTGKFIKTRFHKEIELSSWIPAKKTFPDTLEPVELCYSITTKRFADKTRQNSTWAARVDLCLMVEEILQGKFDVPDRYYFRNVSQLALDVSKTADFFLKDFQRIAEWIDLSEIRELWIIDSPLHSIETIWIKDLLKKTKHLETFGFFYNHVTSRIVNIAPLIRDRVQHVKIRQASPRCVRVTMEQMKNVPLLTFEAVKRSEEILKYLQNNRRPFSFDEKKRLIQIFPDRKRKRRDPFN